MAYTENMFFKHYIKVIIDRLMQFQNEGRGTVFFEINGHVQNIHVRVFTPAWKDNATASFNESVYIDNEDNGEYVNSFVDRLIKYLDGVKQTQPL